MTSMNFNNQNMTQHTTKSIIDVLNDTVMDGKQVSIYDRHFTTLSEFINRESDFIVGLEQIYINANFNNPDDFDLNQHFMYTEFIHFINSVHIIKFSYKGETWFGLNDIFMRNLVKENNNLQEYNLVSEILGSSSSSWFD